MSGSSSSRSTSSDARRQALGEFLGLGQQRGLALQRAHERRAAVSVVAGFGDGPAVEHDGGGEAQRFLAGEVGDLEVLQRDAVLLGDGVHGKS
jgi:hypothetical protein